MVILIYALSIVALVVIFGRVLHFSGVIKYIAVGQIIFIFAGLVVRPIILLYFQPTPEYGDAFADARLIQNGSYNQALSEIGTHVLLGVLVYGIVIIFLQRISKNSLSRFPGENKDSGLVPIFAMLGVTLIAILIEYGGIYQSRVITWISVGALPCAAVAIQAIAEINTSKLKKNALFVSVGLYSFTVSILMASKSPIFFFGFMFLYVFFEKGKNGSTVRISIRKFWYFGILIPLSLLIFNFVQNIKDGLALTFLNHYMGEKYFELVPGLYTVLKRFDLFRAVSDVWYVGQGSWYSFSGYLKIMVSALEWNFGTMAPNFGGQWSIHVLQHSSDASSSPVVSLSQSAIAEGWLLSGFTGIVFVTSLFVMITVGVGILTSSNLFARIVAFYIISSNSLFEGGVVSNLESISTGVRTALLLWLPIRLLNASIATKNYSKSATIG